MHDGCDGPSGAAQDEALLRGHELGETLRELFRRVQRIHLRKTRGVVDCAS